MNLAPKDFFIYLFHTGKTYKNEWDILALIYKTSLKITRIFAFIIVMIELVAFLATFSGNRGPNPYFNTYRAMYLIIFAVMAITFLALIYIKKDYYRRFRLLLWLDPVLMISVMLWIISAVHLMQSRNGHITFLPYIMISLIIPLFLYMHPMIYLALSALCDTIMLALHLNIFSEVPEATIGVVSLYVFLIIKTLIGLLFLFMRFYLRENIITYEEQKKEISELYQAQNRFFSSMSHELRTPINTIIGLNEMILREKVSDEVAEDAMNIKVAGNMLLHIINDILDMSKIRSGQMTLTPITYKPADLISDIVSMIWPRCKDHGLEFHVEISPDLPSELYGDEMRIKQILINLLNNAVKYTKKGSVTLSVQCGEVKEGTVRIIYSVTDTGMGIRKEHIPHLFNEFKRVDETANRKIEGTGLGLSIVKNLTELMNGTITVNSIYTQGSSFVIEIPQPVINAFPIGRIDLNDRRPKNLSGTYTSSFEAPEAKVLAVDDNESNLLVVRKLLRDTKVKLDTVESGAAALEKTLNTPYDVIFMDHLMPEMDGIECLHRIRGQIGGVCKNAKIVALTANAESSMRKLYANEGFDGYVIKPIDAMELESMLRHMLPQNKVNVVQDDSNIVENSMSWLDNRTKKKNVMVTTESVADLPRALIKKYNIAVLPHKVETGSGIFEDDTEVDADGLIDYIKEGHPAVTHVPTVKEHEDFFADALSKASHIIHMTLSSSIKSVDFENATEGAAAFDNVLVFDTKQVSSGEGILALEAARMATENLSEDDMIKRLTQLRGSIRTSFIIGNLDILAGSGQLGAGITSVCKALMIHPVIEIKNGKMIISSFYFGSRSRAWKKYTAAAFRGVSMIDKSELFITYVGLTKKELDTIKNQVEKTVHFENVYCMKASPSVAANCGPGSFGFMYRTKI
ncbi:MAG: DegV family EDD domain-containing protein [Lachnospiraceae bacterium]|nr:DegV family EDD domain-containing protein [Lachnospiraceae bacterium]